MSPGAHRGPEHEDDTPAAPGHHPGPPPRRPLPYPRGTLPRAAADTIIRRGLFGAGANGPDLDPGIDPALGPVSPAVDRPGRHSDHTADLRPPHREHREPVAPRSTVRDHLPPPPPAPPPRSAPPPPPARRPFRDDTPTDQIPMVNSDPLPGDAGVHRQQPRLVVELRIVAMVVGRDLRRYVKSKARILSSFAQPFFFLLIFGVGMRALVSTTGGVNFEQFVFPGVIAMSILGRALLSAASIVHDSDRGFLKEMLVAPASRVSIVFGAMIGGATVSTLQAVLLLFGAPVMGLYPGPKVVVAVLATTALMALEVTALGVALATMIPKAQSFQAVTQAITYPMLVLSGALIPMAGLPGWIQAISKIDIFSYPVDALRRLLLGSDVGSSAAKVRLTGLHLFGHTMTISEELGISAVLTVLFVAVAARGFGRVR